MTTPTTRRRAGIGLGVVASSAALVLAGITPASAEDIQIGPDDVAGFENGDETDTEGYNYDQWHVGSVEDPAAPVDASLTFNECSVTFLEPPETAIASVTQLLKGYPIEERPDTLEEITAVFESLEVEMESGSVTLQVPMFIYSDDPEDEGPDFTTIRNAEPFTEAGAHTLEGEVLVGSGGEDPESVDELLEAIAEAIEEGFEFEVLGVGITGEDGTIVNSLSVGADTAYFGTGDCLPEAPPADDDDADDADAEAPAAPRPPQSVETGH